MIVLGLTGSIGMGKSTTAAMFADEGVPVHDADATVHRLYAGRAAPPIEAAFPGTVKDGIVDRQALSARVVNDPAAMQRLEAIVHPLVGEEERAFLGAARHSGAALAVLDIPLLFETGADKRCDKTVVVTASPEIQRERVLARPDMTEAKFTALLARQMPDADKRARADFLVDTGNGMEAARLAVLAIIRRCAAD
ncbi:dephospho-CoA kinase [Aurantimonas sp. A2-1-M11]|uniref:dephospho-CoA kinase n=1 Tax=Aurantimonas sp. A2-1-M11 TaxID=3113712 RepID=UPI002F956DBA